jgi:hypothetical protein
VQERGTKGKGGCEGKLLTEDIEVRIVSYGTVWLIDALTLDKFRITRGDGDFPHLVGRDELECGSVEGISLQRSLKQKCPGTYHQIFHCRRNARYCAIHASWSISFSSTEVSQEVFLWQAGTSWQP